MSITNDIRSYADSAIEQGKHVVGQAVGQAQSNVNQLTNRASDAVTDLRTQAEKTLNVDAIRTAVEPYLAQAKQYRASVTDRAEGFIGTVTSDKRVARVVSTAESVTGVVVDTVTERVVKPVVSLTGRGTKPAPKATKPAASKTATKKPAAKKASKPAATRPAAKKPAAKSTAKTTAAKSTATKSTATS